ncbi:reductase RED1 [Histoplasma capsulatum G186AR]|uniref:Reductase RED1 n=2 Tax=Ajellomyces capsulatus TaxID=5037 RepID=C0NEW2_AJECG|nr:reductase RED1 [Histoplasma capsulatum G186AR]EEH09783.1 reductase RED1 [Histoplasma capsulatum G186AR]
MSPQNKALFFSKIPTGYPVPGEHLTIQNVPIDPSTPAPENGITVQSLYTSFDPYMRGRMRDSTIKSYSPAFDLGKPIYSRSVAKVLASNNSKYKPDDHVIGFLPVQEYVFLPPEALEAIQLLDNPLGLEDTRVFLGPLGMPGLTAYSSLMEIGKPIKGETIFISAASGAVGQVVGQLAKHLGLKVIGSVGTDAKLDYILNELGFDGGFNYKKEKPRDGLARLAPDGIDIYYENVGGEHLEAAIDAMRDFGRIVACGMISQYNLRPQERYGIKNIFMVISKRITMRGFIVGDHGMGDKWEKQHKETVSRWIKEGSFKPAIAETVGIDNAAEGLVGIFRGENFGKAVLKFQKVC